MVIICKGNIVFNVHQIVSNVSMPNIELIVHNVLRDMWIRNMDVNIVVNIVYNVHSDIYHDQAVLDVKFLMNCTNIIIIVINVNMYLAQA